MSRPNRPRILIVGQTPPPLHGQSAMISALLDAPMESLKRRHVRLAFSDEIANVGKPTLRKVGRLVATSMELAAAVTNFRPDALYFPPASPRWTPVLRDLMMLPWLRRLVPVTVFHFHSGGLGEFYEKAVRGSVVEPLFRRAYFEADVAIRLSSATPEDGQKLRARREVIIPYGIRDQPSARASRAASTVARLLYVGMVVEGKGVAVLVDACVELWRSKLNFQLTLVGACTAKYQAELRARAGPFEKHIVFPGVQVGESKWEHFRSASLFCFPTHYEAEAFPVACIEAMMAQLPVVATLWRGLPDLVKDGVTGRLVPPRDPRALAAAMEPFISDPKSGLPFGEAGRRAYLERYTLAGWTAAIETVLAEAAMTRP